MPNIDVSKGAKVRAEALQRKLKNGDLKVKWSFYFLTSKIESQKQILRML